MKAPLEVIEGIGLPTDSYIRAVQELGEKDWRVNQFNDLTTEILGLVEPLQEHNAKLARLYAMYTVQATIKAFTEEEVPDMDVVAAAAFEQANSFADKNRWAVKMFAGQEIKEIQDDGTVVIKKKRKKGAKRDECERLYNLNKDEKSRAEIIEIFISQAGMTKSGATTYFHNCKAKFGFTKKAGEKKEKKRSKKDLAHELYENAEDKSKAVIMALFEAELNTSRLGAQTYYYESKKWFESK